MEQDRHNPVFNFSVTGDAAHGGLSASAGTPFGNYFMRFAPLLPRFLMRWFFKGQRAGAGLGGTVDGGNEK